MRELYSLAQVMDCLRAGRLGQAADGLAARFIAAHQALEDGRWDSASALELFALESTSSAPTSTLVRAQRDKKLVAKSQGWTPKEARERKERQESEGKARKRKAGLLRQAEPLDRQQGRWQEARRGDTVGSEEGVSPLGGVAAATLTASLPAIFK